jgi:aryl-alcohol dehydrogenase-like predicted oxidoreductase
MALIPRIVAGTARLGFVLPDLLTGRARRDAELRTLDALVEAGCTAFDLAASYQLGGTERLVGQWLASRGHRQKLLLIGKGGHPYPGLRPNRLTADALSADLDASLRRLGIERLDLYLLHRDFPGAPLEPIVEALATAHRAGKIQAWGVSNWTVDRIEAIGAVARRAGLPPPAASSPHFSLVDWVRPPWTGSVSIAGASNREARSFHQRTQLTVLAWSPLGSGFLTSGADRGGCYGSAANVARRERVRALARERGCTPAQIALAYLFSQPFPVSAVVRASTGDKMREDLAAAAMRLTPAEVEALEA